VNPSGLLGDDYWPVALPEGFYSGISYDNVLNAIFTCSRQTGVTVSLNSRLTVSCIPLTPLPV